MPEKTFYILNVLLAKGSCIFDAWLYSLVCMKPAENLHYALILISILNQKPLTGELCAQKQGEVMACRET